MRGVDTETGTRAPAARPDARVCTIVAALSGAYQLTEHAILITGTNLSEGPCLQERKRRLGDRAL